MRCKEGTCNKHNNMCCHTCTEEAICPSPCGDTIAMCGNVVREKSERVSVRVKFLDVLLHMRKIELVQLIIEYSKYVEDFDYNDDTCVLGLEEYRARKEVK